MTTGMALDILLIALLVAGGVGGLFIMRRLNRLVTAQEELRAALAAFDKAAGDASLALQRLEAGGVAKGAQLQAASRRAEALVTELSVMASAGERIADRIEDAVREVKSLGGARGKPKRAA